MVSPTSIRSRILKDVMLSLPARVARIRFTHVDPFEDTESDARLDAKNISRRFTHVDPFEDTER